MRSITRISFIYIAYVLLPSLSSGASFIQAVATNWSLNKQSCHHSLNRKSLAVSSASIEKPVFSGFGHAVGKTPTHSSPMFSRDQSDNHDRFTPASSTSPSFSGFGPTKEEIPSSKTEKESQPNSQELFQVAKQEGLTDLITAARQKVLLIREEMDKKGREYDKDEDELCRDIRNQAEKYDNEYKNINFQFENYKAMDEQEKFALKEEMKARQQALETMGAEQESMLKEEIEVLKQMINLANDEVDLAQNLTTAVSSQHEEMTTQMETLKQRYIDDSMDWEDRLELEQNARQKERVMVDKSLQDLKDEHSKQLRLLRVETSAMAESLRSEMTNQLFQKEMQIQKASLKLSQATPEKEKLVRRATQLERESEHLPTLCRQSVKVVKKKTRNSFQRAKNFFRRDRIA